MIRPGFFEGVVVAVVASISGWALQLFLGAVCGGRGPLQLIVAGSGLGYVLYLLRRSDERVGRLSTGLAWLCSAALIGWFSLSLAFTVVAHAGLIWLVRALYHHRSMLTALADLGLCGCSCAAALWASLQTHSLFASLWCFFLVQALFSFLPGTIARRTCGSAAVAADDRFNRALRMAESAARASHHPITHLE